MPNNIQTVRPVMMAICDSVSDSDCFEQECLRMYLPFVFYDMGDVEFVFDE